MNDLQLTNSEVSNNNTPAVNIWGFSMKGIRPEGRCPKCKNTFKTDTSKGFICPGCLTIPQRFTIDFYYKGERIRRGTTLNSKTLRTFSDAHSLLKQAERDIEAYNFDPDKWKSKKKFEYQFSYLIWEWYAEKEKLMNQGKLSHGYVPKLKAYIKYYYDPYFKNQDVREIFNCKRFANNLPERLSLKYQKNLVDSLRNFFKWLKDERITQEVPVFPLIEVPEYEPQTVSRETQLKFLDIVDVEDKPIFTFLIFQGARPAEVCALMGDCIDGDAVTYKRTFSGRKLIEHTKTKRIRHNYIFPEARVMIFKTFPKQFIFTYGKDSRYYTTDCLNSRYRRYLKRFNEKYNTDLNIPLYEFTKHSFGTQFINKHPEMEKLLQEHFGHTNANMTKRYAKLKVVNAFREFDILRRIVSKQSVDSLKT